MWREPTPLLTQSSVLVPLLTVAMQFSSELRALGAKVEALDGALAPAGKQVVVIHLQERRDILVKPLVVVIHLQERGYILVEPLVVNHRSSGVLTRVTHIDKAILIPHHGDVGVKAEVGTQGRVLTLNSLVPETKTESKYAQVLIIKI